MVSFDPYRNSVPSYAKPRCGRYAHSIIRGIEVGTSRLRACLVGTVPFCLPIQTTLSLPFPFRSENHERNGRFGHHEMHQPFRSQIAKPERLPFCPQNTNHKQLPSNNVKKRGIQEFLLKQLLLNRLILFCY